MKVVFEEESLFQSWRKTRSGFVEDGVVSEQDYLVSSPSIVVILKEVNDPGGGNWDLRQFLREEGGRSQTWNNVARWAHGIRNRGQGDDWPNQYEKISEEFRIEVLRSICVINLNKSPGTHTTKTEKLNKVATEDKVLIQSILLDRGWGHGARLDLVVPARYSPEGIGCQRTPAGPAPGFPETPFLERMGSWEDEADTHQRLGNEQSGWCLSTNGSTAPSGVR